jgi:hypothetical protein
LVTISARKLPGKDKNLKIFSSLINYPHNYRFGRGQILSVESFYDAEMNDNHSASAIIIKNNPKTIFHVSEDLSMSNPKYLLGIDVSTTAVKALLIDTSGKVVNSATTSLNLSTPHPLWSEQDPHDWWTGAQNSIHSALSRANVIGEDVLAIGLTGQMHGLVLLDAHCNVLRPAILWNDQRTGEQCDQMRAIIGKSRLIQITGNDALTGFTAPKILWVAQHEPEVYAKIRHVLLPKDYIRYH